MRHLAVALTFLASPVAAETSLFAATAGMELFPCEQSTLSCATVAMPLDHLANDPSRTIDITFALSFASVESRGILTYIVGGPGVSGLSVAEDYLGSFDEKLTQYMDVVFIDQRGTGVRHGLACPVAQGIFDSASASLADPEGTKTIARTYVSACLAEMDRDEILPFVGSDQAIRDLEVFRQMIGAPRVWLYGESYGTQFVQGYATRFPDAVAGVVMDGVVDLNLDSAGFYRRYILGAEAILARAFAACNADADCSTDMGEDAALAYDRLAARLAMGPITVPLSLADGSTVNRNLTLGQLEGNAFLSLYGPSGRASFLRVLAAANRGNLFPMLQLAYSNARIDPETEIGALDPGWFGAAYFAITCMDYDSGAGTPDERADAILAEAAAFAPEAPRLLRSYFIERIACAYWPHQGPAIRPPVFAGGDYPTLILNGEADPITPPSMAYSVLDEARNAYGVFIQNGPHVIWGRGLACPDEIVYDLMIDGKSPAATEQLCKQGFLDNYLPLTLSDAAGKSDAFAVARAVESELALSIPYSRWDGFTPMTFACDHGGRIAVTGSEGGTALRFTDCRFWPDVTVNGTGLQTSGGRHDDMVLTLGITGPSSGDLVLRHSLRDEAYGLSGTWDGRPARLPRSGI
jgi:pimeloyl-ACP methyl ester carboxylesterase